MEYLEAAFSLISFIKETNSNILQDVKKVVEQPNKMWVKLDEEHTNELVMDTYSNDFVLTTLKESGDSEAFVMTDIASMDVKGKELNYILYKGYHSKIEKGLVFYQMFNKETLEIEGSLRLSNMEENIFYKVVTPDENESSCNAIETKHKIENGKSIAFLIGHMDEERLIYDIQRLIFDTVNNVTKHQKLKFSFIIQISRFGGSPSQELRKKVGEIEEFTKKYFYPVYPNVEFSFVYEENSSL